MTKDELVREWLDHASNDLNSARFLTRMRPEPIEIICYHCQQAAEKYLKALLIQQDKNPGKTHDLNLLSDHVQNDNLQDQIMDSLLVLNDYSVNVRYPGYSDLTEDDKAEALIAAERIETVCLRFLGKEN